MRRFLRCSKLQFKSLELTDRTNIVKKTRRQFVKYLSILPLVGSFSLNRESIAEKHLESGYILVNGWVLKKTDLIDHLR